MPIISACLDVNVIVSAIAFGGTPLKVLDRALRRDFYLILGPNIINTTQRILVKKLGLKTSQVERLMADLTAVASLFVPKGIIHPTQDEEDNLVLEVAMLGDCDVLVTGDKQHLLPLTSFRGVAIEPPSQFLMRFQ